MKKITGSLFLLLALAIQAGAQVSLPQASPRASVSYVVGLTEVRIEYSSPAVKGREIWGKLVPFGEVWRAGANEATTISFSTDVNMEGQRLRAGKYAFFLIPAEGEWTVIFNRKADQWGAYEYDESQDEIRFSVEPKMNEGMQERLSYSILDMKSDMGYIKLGWERMRLFMRFKVDVMEQAMTNIVNALAKSPADKQGAIYAEGADFLLQADANPVQALDWAKKSTDLTPQAWTWHVRARAEAKNEAFAEAVVSLLKCIRIGAADTTDMYVRGSRQQIFGDLQTSVEKALSTVTPERQWIVYAQGAEALLLGEGRTEQALAWAIKSTELREHPWPWYTRAQAEAKAGDYAAAVASAKKCLELGAADPADTYFQENKAKIEEALGSWMARSGQ